MYSFDHFISTFSWTKKWGKTVLKHSRIVRPRWGGWPCCWFWWFWWGYWWCWWWCWWAVNSLLCLTKCWWDKNLNLTAVFFISDHRIEFKSFNRRTMHSSWSMLVTIKTPSSSATPGRYHCWLLAFNSHVGNALNLRQNFDLGFWQRWIAKGIKLKESWNKLRDVLAAGGGCVREKKGLVTDWLSQLDSATAEMLSQPKRTKRSTLKVLLLRFSRTQDEDWEADQDEPWRWQFQCASHSQILTVLCESNFVCSNSCCTDIIFR